MSYTGLSLQYYSLSFVIEQAMKDFKLQLIRAQTFQSLQVVASNRFSRMRPQSFQNYKVINTVIVLSDSESYIMCIQDLSIVL